jgi:Zn-dependent protease with chaperone function
MKRLSLVLAVSFWSGCVSTTQGGAVDADRRQFFLVSSEQIQEASTQAYDQTKNEAAHKGALDRNPAQVQRVQQIMRRLIPTTAIFRKDALSWPWEVHVITSPEINAYCMPGGKIMFYSTLIEKLQLTDAEIAAVMGHEISHALREHGRERMSQAVIEQGLLEIGVASGKVSQEVAQGLSMLAQVFINLRFSRAQESEADTVGVELMARAGYDPREAVNLWKKMAGAGGAKPPEILSDHPADETRLKHIQSLLPKVMPLYEAAANSN